MIQNHMIKVAVAPINMKVTDTAYNTDKIIETMHAYRDCGLIVFPELCITGYTCADLFLNETLLNNAQSALLEIMKHSEGLPDLTSVVSLPLQYRNSLYNCAAYVSEGKVLAFIPKTYIPTYGEFYEGRWFTSGKNIQGKTIMFHGEEIPFGTDILLKDDHSSAVIGTDICEDLWVPDKPSTHACLAGANIIANPSASDEIIGKEDYRRQLVSQQSAACYCAYLYVSSGTDESSTDLVFSGHSMIAENGRITSESIFRNDVLTSIIDLDQISYNRRYQNTYENNTMYRIIAANIQPISQKEEISVDELTEALQTENYKISQFPFVPQNEQKRKERCQKILRIQANGLATRVRNTGIKNLVIGISGGLDSTLALIVCAEAKKIIPDIHIIAYTLPNTGNTTSLTYNNATNLMHFLADEYHEVTINDGVQEHLKAIGHGGEYRGEGDTTYENGQARMRTYILMDVANMRNGLVVGTGDLSELALGWCTYNGDHMSMYGVNTSIPKTLVQFICRTYADMVENIQLRDTIISICDTPITPELTPNKDGSIAQKTEEKIGKYDLNDFFLFYLLRYGMDAEKILAFAMVAYPDLGKDSIKESLLRFIRRFFTQQFKRSCLPDGPKVGSVTLSPRGNWRMPSDASFALWIRKIEEA